MNDPCPRGTHYVVENVDKRVEGTGRGSYDWRPTALRVGGSLVCMKPQLPPEGQAVSR